jgi:hypothetical protein
MGTARVGNDSARTVRDRIGKRDLLWVLAYPLYQLVGTLRHELGHAVVALMLGGKIEKIVFWPTRTEAGFHWGYTVWYGRPSVIVTAAPYILDLVVFGAFFLICTRVRFRRHWVWLNLVILGLFSPFVNSVYSYVRGIMGAGDVASLLQELPAGLVHGCFAVTIAIYVAGLLMVLWPRPRVVADHPPGGLL